jgi:hypothetical protein
MTEFIIAFHPGISEDVGRSIVTSLGGQTRRRMRSDGPDEVQLLARFETDPSDALARRSEVAWSEPNHGGFEPLS